MSNLTWLDLLQSPPERADVLLLPLPYEGTVSYGSGTSRGPAAIVEASTQIELWDHELGCDLDGSTYHTAEPVEPEPHETPSEYHARVVAAASQLHGAKRDGALVVGLGGEHGLTPPLVRAAYGEDLSGLTVVQFDAHADLRAEYEGTPPHACAMRPLVEAGANLLAIGIRSADRDEHRFGVQSGRVTTHPAHLLLADPGAVAALGSDLTSLCGDVYLTVDVDVFEPSLCPGTGTPVPGGLPWTMVVTLLRALLRDNDAIRLVGVDIVETAPSPGTVVNEFTAALLVTKITALRFGLPA